MIYEYKQNNFTGKEFGKEIGEGTAVKYVELTPKNWDFTSHFKEERVTLGLHFGSKNTDKISIIFEPK